MLRRAEILRKNIDDTLFALRIYRMYSRSEPSDVLASEMCDRYLSKYRELREEYLFLCGTEDFTEVNYD